MDTPHSQHADFLKSDGRTRCALALAEAEVRLIAAEAAIRDLEAGDTAPSELTLDMQEMAACIYGDPFARRAPTTRRRFRTGLRALPKP